MNNLRLPTLKQLDKMGAGDAGKVLDYIQLELEKAIGMLDGPGNARYRKNLRAALQRVKNRRHELFG